MNNLKPYTKYKPSGIAWLGDIPQHWEVASCKHLLEIPITDGPHSTPELFEDGIPFISAEAIKNGKIDFNKKRGYISKEDHLLFSKKYIPKRGDIYMVKSGAIVKIIPNKVHYFFYFCVRKNSGLHKRSQAFVGSFLK